MAVGGTRGVGEDDLVTGDAVALRLPVAGVGLRILSGLIDAVVAVAALVLLYFLLSDLVGHVDEALGAALALVMTVTAFVALPLAVERLSGGRSLGRLATGTCVVRSDGGPVAFRQSLVRALVAMPETWLTAGSVAICACLVSPRGQRLGDLAAGTVCVRDRQRLQLPPPVPSVGFLEPWARGADLAPLPDALALGIRQFLARRERFDPVARERVGRQLTAEVSRLVSPPPPPGTHPEAMLQAVLAERGRRDAERLSRDEDLRRRLRLS